MTSKGTAPLLLTGNSGERRLGPRAAVALSTFFCVLVLGSTPGLLPTRQALYFCQTSPTTPRAVFEGHSLVGERGKELCYVVGWTALTTGSSGVQGSESDP